MNDPETVLVTGGSGFIGGWCVIRLLQQGYTVRTTVRSLSRENLVRAALGEMVDVTGPPQLPCCRAHLRRRVGGGHKRLRFRAPRSIPSLRFPNRRTPMS